MLDKSRCSTTNPGDTQPGCGEERDRRWSWRNARDVGLRIEFWPLPWSWHWGRYIDVPDCYGGGWYLNLGPLMIGIQANIGNASTGDWRARLALSESEAWDRSPPFRHRRDQ